MSYWATEELVDIWDQYKKDFFVDIIVHQLTKRIRLGLGLIFGKNGSLKDINIGSWNKGSYDDVEQSLTKHFEKHKNEVGAEDEAQYLRKAQEFARNLKGAKKSKVDGHVPGVTRYKKNGKYVDIAPDGTIVSFGKQ